MGRLSSPRRLSAVTLCVIVVSVRGPVQTASAQIAPQNHDAEAAFSDAAADASPPSASPPQLPDIVLILLDDLDLIDVGAYGTSDIVTNTIDTIATQGVRFTQFYANGPVCSPTRAAILTGRFPA